MKKSFFLSFLLCFSFFVNKGFSQSVVPVPYELGVWKGFAKSAVTYTFDDACANQFKVAMPIFDEYGFKMTFFIITGQTYNWETLQEVATNGHEVASHTITHPNLSGLSAEEQDAELRKSKDSVERNIPEFKCTSHAYPYCVQAADSIFKKYYLFGRGCQGYIETKTPSNYFNISSIGIGSDGHVKTFNDFKSKFTSSEKNGGWCVFLIHGVDNDGGYSPIKSEELRKSIEYLDERRCIFWVASFSDVAMYSKERNCISLSEISLSDTSIYLSVSDTLNDSLFNYPVSIRRPLPSEWPSADVKQAGEKVYSRIVKVDSTVYLMFDVVPDKGEVIISKNLTYVEPEVDSVPSEIIINPETGFSEENDAVKAFCVNNKLVIQMDNPNKDICVGIYDLTGNKLMSEKFSQENSKRFSVDFNVNYLKTGLYLIEVNDGNRIFRKKLFMSM